MNYADKPKKRNRKSVLWESVQDQAINLYKNGLTTREAANLLGLSCSYLHRKLQEIGLTRSKSEALSCKYFKETSHWRSCRNRARKIVEKHLKRKLRRDEHVHHKNRDFTDNRLENLEVLGVREHAHLHHPPNPVPRWLRPARQEYMRTYGAEYRRKNAGR